MREELGKDHQAHKSASVRELGKTIRQTRVPRKTRDRPLTGGNEGSRSLGRGCSEGDIDGNPKRRRCHALRCQGWHRMHYMLLNEGEGFLHA